jgi:DNA-directed RNA polymerase specialized sigma24 family protein
MSRPSSPPPAAEAEWVGILPRLRRYARVLAVQADAADDLVAETLARARHPGFAARPSSTPLSLMAIMHRLHERRRSRYRAAGERAVEPPHVATPGGHDVLDGLWQLATDEREVLLLVAVEGLAYEDVATLLDVPPAAVIARLSGARAKLRALMGSASNDA